MLLAFRVHTVGRPRTLHIYTHTYTYEDVLIQGTVSLTTNYNPNFIGVKNICLNYQAIGVSVTYPQC